MDFAQRREELLTLTKRQLRDSVGPDVFIMQSLAAVDDIQTQVNNLTGRLREWAGYIVPVASRKITDHAQFAKLVAETDQEAIRQQFSDEMGAPIPDEDWKAIQGLAGRIAGLSGYRVELLAYLEGLLSKHARNLHVLLGTTIAARLIATAGGRRRLAMMPASTVQLLGAEKALFRHLKTGARSPKHGYIVNHQLIQQAKRDDRGKVARALGDKAAMCARLDYFEGDFLALEYLKELEATWNK